MYNSDARRLISNASCVKTWGYSCSEICSQSVGSRLWQLHSAVTFNCLKVREEWPQSSLTSRLPSDSGVISRKNGIPTSQRHIIHGTHMHKKLLTIYTYRLVHGCSDKRQDLFSGGTGFESRLDCRLPWCRFVWYFSVEIPWMIWNMVLQKDGEDQLERDKKCYSHGGMELPTYSRKK
jgi:hypothetical protein